MASRSRTPLAAKQQCPSTATCVAEHQSPLGKMWSEWTERGLWSLRWGNDRAQSPSPQKLSQTNMTTVREWVESLDERLQSYFEFGCTTFETVQVDESNWTPFMKAVYRHCREIQPGTRQTYKQLAECAGSPRASRAVGSSMARNRMPIVIPCHRVVASSGKLCGFSAPGGLDTKQYLLDLESDNAVQITAELAI
ncbi:methylated-DNA--[protein]-cysteine S-methyltransferase [Novipirellula sp. SH528]|uniref:methylated-DNA--[protein]-cysteine S-methyltransferase n=1 Tax=Novipirellula sp. SH528 TaxID=3454466 RepID=UPI003FA0F194